MKDFKDFTIMDFKRVEGRPKLDIKQATKQLSERVIHDHKPFVSFFRTKPGCYKPEPYELKYRKLSEVL